MRIPGYISLIAAMMLLFSCGPSKAYIDYTMSEGIIWPGPPEKPRIKYLWSLQRIRGGPGGSKIMELLAGHVDYDIEDPRNSDILVRPHGVFVGDDNYIYISDPGAGRVNVINLSNNDSFIIENAGGMKLAAPIGVATDGVRIYIADADLARVAIFDKKGKFIRFFDGAFKRPTGIALSPSLAHGRKVYVTDTWEHTVYIYSMDGRRLSSFGSRGEGPGELNFPTHLAVDGDGMVYVSDTLNFRIQIFTSSGGLAGGFGVLGDSFGAFDKIKGVAVDREGHVYVVDSQQDTVQIYDKDGRLLLFFGQKGSFYGDLWLPAGIYIDSKNRIFIADGTNMRIQAFQFLGGD